MKASMKKLLSQGQERDSHVVSPVDKLAILQSTAQNAESHALIHCLRTHIALVDLINSHILVIINHEKIIEICHSNTDVFWT